MNVLNILYYIANNYPVHIYIYNISMYDIYVRCEYDLSSRHHRA